MAPFRDQQRGRWTFQCYFLFSTLFISLVISAPSPGDWQALKAQLNGNLQPAHPLAYPCFPHPNGQNDTNAAAECVEVQDNFLNASYRTSVYNGFFHTYNDGCVSNTTDQCLLSPNNPFGPVSGPCTQGLVSEYYIEIREASDVQAAFAFARRTGVALSIKASGHDYLGRSSRKGSLALWTRNLKQKTYHPSFQLSGAPTPSSSSSSTGVQAVTLGAGVNFDEAYLFADQNNITLIGGSSPTVTMGGGWTLFGGHSALSPLYGLGADRVLEITLVTPDGTLRTANAYTNPDLFWALRGGGAGAFGLVLSMTVKVEPALPLTLAEISFPATASNQLPFLSLLVNHSAAFAEAGWGGPMGSSYIALVHPGTLDLNATAALFSPLATYAKQQGHNATVNYVHFPTWYAFYTTVVAPSGAPGIAQPNFVSFRVLPKSTLLTPPARSSLLNYFSSLLAQSPPLAPQILQTPPHLYAYEQGSTSVNQAWRNSYWMVGSSVTEQWNATLEEREEGVEVLKRVVTGGARAVMGAGVGQGAVYPNESDPWVKGWEEEYWGSGYGRLVEVKRNYDEDGLLDCWRCVGFGEGGSEETEAFECWEAFDGLE